MRFSRSGGPESERLVHGTGDAGRTWSASRVSCFTSDSSSLPTGGRDGVDGASAAFRFLMSVVELSRPSLSNSAELKAKLECVVDNLGSKAGHIS